MYIVKKQVKRNYTKFVSYALVGSLIVTGGFMYEGHKQKEKLIQNKLQVIEEQKIAIEEMKEDNQIEITYYNIPLSEELQQFIFDESLKAGLSYEMVLAQFWQESRLNPKAVSKPNKDGSRDWGLAQLNDKPECREDHIKFSGIPKEEFDPLNPYHSIKAAIGVLKNNREYWIKRGIANEENLFHYTFNGYNLGNWGYRKYLKNRKSNKEWHYSLHILKYKQELEQYGEFLN